MSWLPDKKIIKRYSKFLLFLENGTKKYLPVSNDRFPKNNQKNMNRSTGKHAEHVKITKKCPTNI